MYSGWFHVFFSVPVPPHIHIYSSCQRLSNMPPTFLSFYDTYEYDNIIFQKMWIKHFPSEIDIIAF